MHSTDGDVKVENIPGWKEKQYGVAKHLILKFMRRTDDESPEHSKAQGSEHEFINAETVAMSPNAKTPPYDSLKLVKVEDELGAPRSVIGSAPGINWFFIHCVLCPKVLMTMHLRLARNGGLFFFVPLLVTMCLISAPLAFMELALGQYTSKQAVSIFSRISPVSAGVGYAMFIMRFVLAVSVKTEHRLGSLTWEFMGSAFLKEGTWSA